MRSPVPDYLQEIIDDLATDTSGAVAGYIPELADADPDVLGIALTTVDGRTHSAGDDAIEFSIQSISKPFTYAAALTDRGFDEVAGTVGVEPSGEAFNELSLEGGSCRPRNPMINAGAIATHALLVGPSASIADRVERARSFYSDLAGRELSIDDSVFSSELETADRNLAIAHMLRNYSIIEDAAHDVVEGYTRQCSVLVTARDLAVMGATLANAGVQPVTGKQVVSRRVARQTLSVMAGCGMYDGAGEWLTQVGIPAKSGVAGGLLGALPGQCGIAVMSPRLDDHGNSVRGVRAFRRMSDDMGMHLFESESYGSTVLREITVVDDATRVTLRGTVQFSGAEVILDALAADTTGTPQVILDVSGVDHVTDVGRRMLLEGLRRISLDGRSPALYDPESILPEPDLGDGSLPELVREL